MKLISVQENLKKGLLIVSHGTGKNINLPILNNILIKAHTDTIGFNKELQALYYYKPEVTQLIDNHEDKIRKTCLELLLASKNLITVSDFEATSIICVNLISSTVDTIVFKKTTLDSNRIIDGCIEAIIKYITR